MLCAYFILSHLLGLTKDEQQLLQKQLQARVDHLAPIYHQVFVGADAFCYNVLLCLIGCCTVR